MATPTQRYSYKQGCEVGVPVVAVLSLDLMTSESQIGVGFLDLVCWELDSLLHLETSIYA